MSDKDIYKECAATSTAALEEYITNPCIPKNENEWWASREITRLRAENEKLREAFGLISTISPNMEVDVNDYIGMAQKIYAANKKLNEELNCWHEAANWPEKSPHDIHTENEKLREALKPFAYNYQDNGLSHSMHIFKMKDLLAAKKVLESGDE